MTRAVIALIIFALVLLSPFIVSIASGNFGDAPLKPDLDPGIDSDVTECVRDVDYMRMNHMLLLKDERAEAVRHGEREDSNSIKECFTCHTYEDFCEECHKYNGVEPTCFGETGGCHSTEQPGLERPEI